MRVGRKAAGRTRRAVLGPCPSEDGGGPGSLPGSPERTACRPRARKVREEAGKTKRAFSGFEAEPGQTPHQSRFGRPRAFANEALHANLAAGGGSAAGGTPRRSHPGRELGGRVGPSPVAEAPPQALPRSRA